MRILVLDDDPFRHKVFVQALHGHDITHVWTCEQAMNALIRCQVPFDLAYLDHDLGEVDGQDGTFVANFIASGLHMAKWPKRIVIHSWNDVGARRMHLIMHDAGLRRISRVPFSASMDVRFDTNG